jgi:hypothetical protein
MDYKNIFSFDEISEIFDADLSLENLEIEFSENVDEGTFGWIEATVVGQAAIIALFVLPFGLMKLKKYLYAKQKANTLKAMTEKEKDPAKKEKIKNELDLATKTELAELEELKKTIDQGKEKIKTLTPEEKKAAEEKAAIYKTKLDTIAKRKKVLTMDTAPALPSSESLSTETNEEFGLKQATFVDIGITASLFAIPIGVMALNKYLYARQKKKTLEAIAGKEKDPVKKERLSTQLDLASRAELKELATLKKAQEEGEAKLKDMTPEQKAELKDKAAAFKVKLADIEKRNVAVNIAH